MAALHRQLAANVSWAGFGAGAAGDAGGPQCDHAEADGVRTRLRPGGTARGLRGRARTEMRAGTEGSLMKAVMYERQGAAGEVLQVVDLPRPEPGPGEVRVRVSFSGINPTDWKSRSGATPRPLDRFQVPHHDGSGVIDAVGPGVDEGRLGQRVWVWMAAAGSQWGTAAEWTVVSEQQAVALPEGASLELGASLGVPALTAHRCLFADGDLDGSHRAGGGRSRRGRPLRHRAGPAPRSPGGHHGERPREGGARPRGRRRPGGELPGAGRPGADPRLQPSGSTGWSR